MGSCQKKKPSEIFPLTSADSHPGPLFHRDSLFCASLPTATGCGKSWMSLSSYCSQLMGTDLDTGSMPTIITTHLGRAQDAAATSKAAAEQHQDHGPLWDGIIPPLRFHLSIAHEVSSAASPMPSLLNCGGIFPSGPHRAAGRIKPEVPLWEEAAPGGCSRSKTSHWPGSPSHARPCISQLFGQAQPLQPMQTQPVLQESPPVTLQPPDHWVLPQMSQSPGTTTTLVEPSRPLASANRTGIPPAHHTASGKPRYSVFQQLCLCLPAGWCLGITPRAAR